MSKKHQTEKQISSSAKEHAETAPRPEQFPRPNSRERRYQTLWLSPSSTGRSPLLHVSDIDSQGNLFNS